MSMTKVEEDISKIQKSMAVMAEAMSTFKDEMQKRPTIPAVSLEIQSEINKQLAKCERHINIKDRKWLIGLISASIGSLTMAIIAFIKA